MSNILSFPQKIPTAAANHIFILEAELKLAQELYSRTCIENTVISVKLHMVKDMTLFQRIFKWPRSFGFIGEKA